MGISKSNRKSGRYTGGALLFSGRPDPTWSVGKNVALKLEETWNSLQTHKGEFPSPPLLGYRGCYLKSDRGIEWLAFEGVVTLLIEGRQESRKDIERTFERLVLSSAPKGLLPLKLLPPQLMKNRG